MIKNTSTKNVLKLLAALSATTFLAAPALSAQVNDKLPDPDGKAADMSKPVQVFIIMGQSNTLEMGKVGKADKMDDGTLMKAVKEENLYPFMVDDEGNWTKRNDVRQVHVMQHRGNTKVGRNDFLSVNGGKIGIDQGIGHQLGNAIDAPVMVLRSSIGNRSLGWDLLPPGSKSYEFTDPKDGKTYVYAGYKESPLRWEKGTEPEPIGWYAGKQYDDDVANAKKVLEELETYYPGAKGYEVAGFLWWQGDKDRYNAGHASKYGENLKTLIAALRKEFNAPNAKFVAATLGQTDKDNPTNENEKMILEGVMSVEGMDGVGTVYTHPLSMGSSSNAHYGGNAKTYMNVGLAMGEKMVQLLDE